MAQGAGAYILILDDDGTVSLILQRRLQAAGFAATAVRSGEDALQAIRSGGVELLLLDYLLDDNQNGLDFYRELKAQGYDLPTILITAFTNEAVVIEALRAGVRDFVSKSQDYLDYLPEAVEHVLNEVRLERRVAESELRLVQSQKMEALGRLAGGVAHDFNNLLTIILSYAEIALESREARDELAEYLRQIIHAGERASALTGQLLALSRRQVLAPTALDLNLLVIDMDRLLRRLIGEDIELVTALAWDLYPVKADPAQIEQILLNLTVNARDAMPRGGRLTIETANVALREEDSAVLADVAPAEYVLLSVNDNGCGMDESTKARAFEPFFTTKEPGKGTGMGLSIVYAVVQQSGGQIAMESCPGAGTTFKIYLPRADIPVRTSEPDADALVAVSGTETILLVEDQDVVRGLGRRILETNGYTVLEAAHGDEALRISDEHADRIDLLVTDVVMPVMSGREVADRLIVRRPELKVLYVSGYTEDAIDRHGVPQPGTDFLQKPFTLASLIRKVRQVLDN